MTILTFAPGLAIAVTLWMRTKSPIQSAMSKKVDMPTTVFETPQKYDFPQSQFVTSKIPRESLLPQSQPVTSETPRKSVFPQAQAMTSPVEEEENVC